MVAPWTSVVGHPNLQPGPEHGGKRRDRVARLARWDWGEDWAVAGLTGRREWRAELFESASRVTGVRYPKLGDVLAKSACSTGETRGLIDGIGTHLGLQSSFRLVPDADADQPVSLRGDSGAVWYDPQSGEGVGLHSKGPIHADAAGGFAVASFLAFVLRRSGVALLP